MYVSVSQECQQLNLKIYLNSLRMSSLNSKTLSLVCLYNKQNITCLLVDKNFVFSYSTRYPTHSLRSLMRYQVEHSKIKFVSTRGHAISYIYNLYVNRKLLVRMSPLSFYVLHYGSQCFSGLNKKENAPNKSSVHLDFCSCTLL